MGNEHPPPTRQERRIAAREQRRAAQRAAALAATESKKLPVVEEPRFKSADAVALAALPLGYAAMSTENNLIVGACFSISGLIACAPIAWHNEIKSRYKLLYCAFICVLCFGLFSIIRSENLTKELTKREGTLEAGNSPSYDRCSKNAPSNSVVIDAGSVLLQITKFPFVLLSINGEKNVVLDQEPNGNLVITRLLIFDDRNDKVVKIDEGGYWVHPNSEFKHPSRSEIAVWDHANTKVLSLNLRNRNSLFFRTEIKSAAGSLSITDKNVIGRAANEASFQLSELCLIDFGFVITPSSVGLLPNASKHI